MPLTVTTAGYALATVVALSNLGGVVNLPFDQPKPSLETVAEVNLCATLVAPMAAGMAVAGKEAVGDFAYDILFKPSQGAFKETIKDVKSLMQAPRALSYDHQKQICRKGLKALGLGAPADRPSVASKPKRDEDSIQPEKDDL